MIKKGCLVKILPQWQDPGDEDLIWKVIHDEDGGRVMITPINLTPALPIPPVSTVLVSQVALLT